MSNRHRLCCEGPAGSQGGRKNLKIGRAHV